MPAEEIYQPRVNPGATAGLPQAGADAFGAGVGEGIGQLGAGIGRIADVQREQKARSEALAAGVQAARARANVDIFAEDLKRQPGGEVDYAAKVAEKRKQERDTALAGITNRRVLERHSAEWDAYDAADSVNAHAYEAVATGANQIAGLKDQKAISAARVRANPAALEDELTGWRTSVLATSAPDLQKNAVVAEGAAELVEAHLDALPPAEAKDELAKYAGLLPPDAQRQWSDRLDAKIAREQSQARAAQSQAMTVEREAIATTAVQLNAGRADPAEWQALAQRQEAIGDTSAAASSRLKAREIEVSEGYRGATPVERDQRIATLAAKPTLSPAEGVELKGLQGQQRYVASLSTLDRAAFATGRAVVPLDLTDPASIQQRVMATAAAQKQYGGKGDFFLLAEAEQVQGLVQGGLDQRIQAASVIAQAGRFAPGALDQVAGNDQAFRAAATLAPLPNGGQLMRDALSGPEALKASPNLLTPARDEAGQPVSAKPAQIFDGRLQGALAALPGGFGAALRTNAENIYLANARRRGLTSFSADGYIEAINQALGGTRTAAGWAGGVHLWRGQPVVLPRGMIAADYEARLSRANGHDWVAAGNGVPWSTGGAMYTGELRGMVPVMVRDGIYRLRDGNSYVTLKDGRQFEFDVRRMPGAMRAPAASAAQPGAAAPAAATRFSPGAF